MIDEEGGDVTPGAVSSGRRLFRNTLVSGATSVLVLAIAMAIVPFHIDRLGEEAYGVWVLVLSFSLSGGFLSLADLGLQQSLVTFVAGASRREDVERHVRSALVLFCLLAVAGVMFLLVLAWLSSSLFEVPAELVLPLRLLLSILAVEAVVGLPALAALGLLEGLQRYGWVRGAEVLRQVTYAAATVLVLLAGGDLVAFGMAAIGAALVGHVGFWVGAWRVWGRLPWGRPDRAAVRDLRRVGGWLFVSKVTGTAWRQMDKTILSILVSTTILAPYDVANKIQAAARTVLSFTSSALLPATAELAAAADERRLRDLLLRGTRYTMALSLPVVTSAMILAPELIEAWIGPELLEATTATRLFLAYQLFVGLATVMFSILVGLGHARTTARYGVLALLVNLVGSVALAPRYELAGVVGATLVGYALSTSLYLRVGLRLLDLRLGDFLRITLVPLVPWTVVIAIITEGTRRLLAPTSLAGVALVVLPGAVSYAAGVWWRVFGADERTQLRDYARAAAGRPG